MSSYQELPKKTGKPRAIFTIFTKIRFVVVNCCSVLLPLFKKSGKIFFKHRKCWKDGLKEAVEGQDKCQNLTRIKKSLCNRLSFLRCLVKMGLRWRALNWKSPKFTSDHERFGVLFENLHHVSHEKTVWKCYKRKLTTLSWHLLGLRWRAVNWKSPKFASDHERFEVLFKNLHHVSHERTVWKCYKLTTLNWHLLIASWREYAIFVFSSLTI